MDRRNFLQIATMALAGEGLKRCWPFRVYSFPAEIVIPSRSWEAIDWGFASPAVLTHMRDMHPYLMHPFMAEDLVPYLVPCVELPLADLKAMYPEFIPASDRSEDREAAKAAETAYKIIYRDSLKNSRALPHYRWEA